jgi:hypothetical protein
MSIAKTNVTLSILGAGFDAGSQVKDAPKRSLLLRVLSGVVKFFDEWSQHSYDAWVRAGRPHDF